MKEKRPLVIGSIVILLGLTLLVYGGETVEAGDESSSIVYITSSGDVSPENAPIKRCGDLYGLTGDIKGALYIERSDLVVNGNGYEINAPDDTDEKKYGIKVDGEENVTLFDLEITGFSLYGIYLRNSDDCMIAGNTIIDSYIGIRFEGSDNCMVFLNDIYENSYKGLYIINSDGNEFFGNDIETTTWCAFFDNNCQENTLYYNNFKDFTRFADVGSNTWDNGNGEGNYWDSYTGSDDGSGGRTANDGIGDTGIPHRGVDSYPLMNEWDNDDPYNIIDLIEVHVDGLPLSCWVEKKVSNFLGNAECCLEKYEYFKAKGYNWFSNIYKYLSVTYLNLAEGCLRYQFWNGNIDYDDWFFSKVLVVYTVQAIKDL